MRTTPLTLTQAFDHGTRADFLLVNPLREWLFAAATDGELLFIDVRDPSAPKLLLIDEPSLGLSPRLVKENFNIIRSINERGITVLLVEQNVHQTLAISHFGFVLSKGRVAASGNPAELAAQPEVRDAYFG